MTSNSSLYAKVAGISTAVAGFFTLEEWAIVVGIFCTLGTFAVNLYYKKKEFNLRAKKINGKDTG